MPHVELQFVLLWHDCPATYRAGPHADLMIESGETLATWSLPAVPEPWAAGLAHAAPLAPLPLPMMVERLADHRRAYLDYEGPVSGDRGTVRRLIRAPIAWRLTTGDAVTVDVLAGPLAGTLYLARLKSCVGAAAAATESWRLDWAPAGASGGAAG